MKRCLPFLVALIAVCAHHVRAESCPWLTQGTAAALLGGDVTTTVQSSSSNAGFCRFSLRYGTTTYSLEIGVGTAAGAPCPATSPAIAGVGSEAFACTAKRSAEDTVDIISGRVREIAFAVRLSAKGRPDPHMSQEKRSEIVERAAEAVAGSLF